MHVNPRRGVLSVAAVLLAACGGGQDAASDLPSTPLAEPPAASQGGSVNAALRLARAGGAAVASVDRRLARAHGTVQVWVALDEPSVAAFKADAAAAMGDERAHVLAKSANDPRATALAERAKAQHLRVKSQQQGLASQLASLGAQELGRVQVAHNALAVSVDAARLSEIAALPGVASVQPVVQYEMALSTTLPQVGATAVQARGYTGKGVTVAVLDSGIDYTHYNLGGAGTTQAFAAAYGSVTGTDGLFPTSKVIGGYDFVGEAWPDGPRTEDPDPIDREGHGTHVADIIAGRSADGRHRGVAPDAKLLAVKVCSAVQQACNGVSLLRGMDFALDPDGDGDPRDAADVINLSLGTPYGQPEDALSAAAANAVKLGVVVVASAGNSGNRPYSLGSPGSEPAVIAVAQTEAPDARAFPLRVTAPSSIAGSYANTAVMDWAPLANGFSGTVAYVGQGCPQSGTDPEDPYLDNPAGRIALIDRGTCSVSLKVDRATRAGATGIIIGLTAPGDPTSFSYGGGSVSVPTVVVTQALASRIKANLLAPVSVSLSDAGFPLQGSVANTSARGPGIPGSGIKPDIGAPGTSISADAGTGNGQSNFSGTSGAAPMVSGAAALLLQAYPRRTPMQIKSMLMNSAEPRIYTNKVLSPTKLAPVSRIGAGELRVDRALTLDAVARNVASQSASLSFGFPQVTQTARLVRTVQVENFASTARVFQIRTSYRTVGGGGRGAVRVFAPSSVRVPARGKAEFEVKLIIDGERLPDWTLDGGANGGNGALLDRHEFDGLVTLSAGDTTLTLPWHVLPRKSSAFAAAPTSVTAGQAIRLSNFGAAVGSFDVFSLTGVSARTPRSQLPGAGDEKAFIDLRAVGVRLLPDPNPDNDLVQFAINTFGRRSHPAYPAEFDIGIDVNRDGNADFVVYTAELDGMAESGQSAVNVLNIATQQAFNYYYSDADLNSANVILTVPRTAIGLSRDSTFDFDVGAFDNYYTLGRTDFIDRMTYTLNQPRVVARNVPADGVIPPFSAIRLGTSLQAEASSASPSQSGLLILYRHDAGREADIVRIR